MDLPKRLQRVKAPTQTLPLSLEEHGQGVLIGKLERLDGRVRLDVLGETLRCLGGGMEQDETGVEECVPAGCRRWR